MNNLSDKDRIHEVLLILLAAKTDSLDVLDYILKALAVVENEKR